MNFFITIYQSVYNSQWLRDQKVHLAKAWAFFLPFIFLVAILHILPLLWVVPNSVESAREWIINNTSDFTVQMVNGELSIEGLNQPFEYTLTGSNETKTKVIIDTQTQGQSVENLVDPESEEGVFISKTGVQVYHLLTKQTEEQTFNYTPDFQYTKAQLLEYTDRLTGGIWYVIFIFLGIGVYIIFLIAKLVYILFFSLVLLLVNKIIKQSWSFREIFIIGLYAVTLPTVLSLLFKYGGVYVPFIPTLAFLFLMSLVLFKKDTSPKVLNDENKSE